MLTYDVVIMPSGPVPTKDGRGARSVRSERDARIWALSIEGWSQAEIGAEMGLTQARVSQIINAVALAIKRPAAEAWLERENARLDNLEVSVRAVLKAKHIMVRGDGVVQRAVLDPKTGLPMLHPDTADPIMEDLFDDEPVLKAVDRLLKIYERRAKLNGLDAPTKVETATYDYSVNGVKPEWMS